MSTTHEPFRCLALHCIGFVAGHLPARRTAASHARTLAAGGGSQSWRVRRDHPVKRSQSHCQAARSAGAARHTEPCRARGPGAGGDQWRIRVAHQRELQSAGDSGWRSGGLSHHPGLQRRQRRGCLGPGQSRPSAAVAGGLTADGARHFPLSSQAALVRHHDPDGERTHVC